MARFTPEFLATIREIQRFEYEGAVVYHPGRWWSTEGCLDAKEAMPAGSMVPTQSLGSKPTPTLCFRGEDWVWVTDSVVGDRVRIPGGFLEAWNG